MDSSGAENCGDAATGAVAATGTGAAGTGSVAAGAVVFLAGGRAGVFLAGAVFLAGVALVLGVAAAGRTFAGAVSGDGAGEVAGRGAVTGLVGRGGAVAVKTSLNRAKKASAGRAETSPHAPLQPPWIGRFVST